MSNRGRHRKKPHLVVQILGTTVSNRMMQLQKEQGNISDLNIFLTHPSAGNLNGGFAWGRTTEGWDYWSNQIEALEKHPLYKQYRNDWR